MNIKVIAFDADDTLWVNEPYFRETEEQFAGLLEDFMPHHSVLTELYKTEIANLPLYGYGIKGFSIRVPFEKNGTSTSPGRPPGKTMCGMC